MNKSFKNFIKEEEQKNPHPFMSSIQDEIGISLKDLPKEVQIGSFYSVNGVISNIGPYKVVKSLKNDKGEITHAVIKIINDKSIKNRNYKNKDGKLVRVDAEKEDKTHIVPIGQLDKLMSQDFAPPPQTGI